MNAPAPPPTVAELKERVAEREAALNRSLDGLVEGVRHAADWRRVVQEHPLECALGAATLGFLVTYRPEIMGKSAESSVKLLLNFGAESLVQAAAHRFMGGDPAGGGPTGGAS